jgi:MFS family permease
MKRIKKTLLFIQITSLIASNLLVPIYAVYVKDVGGDLLTAGTAIALNYCVVGALVIASGRFANKYHTERIQLVLGYLLSGIAALCFMLTKSPTQLFFSMIVSGVSISIIAPSFSGLYSKNIEEGKHTSSWGDYWGLTYWGAAIASVIAGVVSQRYGFDAIFIIMMVLNGLSALGAVYLYFLPRKR